MPNPNPNEATRFKTDREESLTATMYLRMPPSVLKKLKQQKGWQEKARKAMFQLVAELEEEEKDLKSA